MVGLNTWSEAIAVIRRYEYDSRVIMGGLDAFPRLGSVVIREFHIVTRIHAVGQPHYSLIVFYLRAYR